MTPQSFSDSVLSWFKSNGRKNLPWQVEATSYKVWVSEIMIQKTQVVTVIPYFERFMKRFPDVHILADATLDDVLHHWTGLGYYARARNLHKSAKIITSKYQGSLPLSFDEIITLPGIGRSTAGAILSLSHSKRFPILDGNVKRVLTRYHGIKGWPGKKKVENKLWEIAELHTPTKSIKQYTQAIMDLGATVCTRRNPDCDLCPLMLSCFAKEKNKQHNFPEKKPRAAIPERDTIFAILENDCGEILLEQRPLNGIWGGLWCFPEFSEDSKSQDGVPKGKVTKHQFTNSKVYPGTVRDYWIYVPHQYDKSKPACLMVFQDGDWYQNLSGHTRAPIVFDNLIHKKEMPVIIGVFVNPGIIPPQKEGGKPRKNRRTTSQQRLSLIHI